MLLLGDQEGDGVEVIKGGTHIRDRLWLACKRLECSCSEVLGKRGLGSELSVAFSTGRCDLIPRKPCGLVD